MNGMRCVPVNGFECWQYKNDRKDVPFWLLQYLILQPSNRVEFQWPNGGDIKINDGDWIVLADRDQEAVMHYSNEEFEKLFMVMP